MLGKDELTNEAGQLYKEKQDSTIFVTTEKEDSKNRKKNAYDLTSSDNINNQAEVMMRQAMVQQSAYSQDEKNRQRRKNTLDSIDPMHKNEYFPSRSVLFANAMIVDDNSRAKERSKKSFDNNFSFYARGKNASAIAQAANTVRSKRYNRMTQAMFGRVEGCNKETFSDLSFFVKAPAGGSDSMFNRQLLDNYLGAEKNTSTGEIIRQDRNAALDSITKMMFSIDVSGINFDSDADIVKNSAKLEQLYGSVGAYDRLLMKNPQYMSSLSKEAQREIIVRLEQLRAIACYYLTKKQEMTNDTFYINRGRNQMTLINKEGAYKLSHAGDLDDPDEQRAYIEKAYTSMDYVGIS